MKDIETGEIDFDMIRQLAKKYHPKIILAGFSAYPRELDYEKFVEIGNEVGAMLMADMAHIAGLIVAGVAKNPLDYGFHVITSTTHKTLRGPRGGLILSQGTVGNPLRKVDKTLDNLPTLIDRMIFPGTQGGPLMHVIAAKAVAFGEALEPSFKIYAEQIVKNAKVLADELMKRGFKLITNGTDNHLILSDVYKSFGLDGSVVETVLDEVGLTLNKNAVPDDSLPPYKPSGIRLGTPAVTTRGLVEHDMVQLAEWMHQAVMHRDDKSHLKALKNTIKEFSLRFPLPSDTKS
jgi:glycine hydroxymethyltransferase